MTNENGNEKKKLTVGQRIKKEAVRFSTALKRQNTSQKENRRALIGPSRGVRKQIEGLVKVDTTGQRTPGEANLQDVSRNIQLNRFNGTVVVRKRHTFRQVGMGRDRAVGRRADGKLIFLKGPLQGQPVDQFIR